MNLTLDDFQAFAETHLLPLGLRLLVALLIFLVGRQVAKLLLRAIDRVMERGDMDVSLRKFLGDLAYAVMLVAVVIAALDAVGVETTAVIAVLGAAGLAIGLALQGSLSNFAAGVMLIALRPYKVGDLVIVAKYLGRVDAIRVFQTILITGDHREVTIPNGEIIKQPIENLTTLGRRRVDFLVSVAQAADLQHVRQLLESVVASDPRIEQDPPVTIEIAEISDAGMKLYLRPWTSVIHYQKVATETMERIKATMETAQLKYSVSLQAAWS
jgi:small conductance mechanosensitive channel